MKRLRTWTLSLLAAGILLCLPPRPAFADWEWKDKLTLNFEAPVLDVSELPDGSVLFILTPKEVLVYSVAGKKVEKRIPLDKTYDNLMHSPRTNTLILTSRSEKALKIIQLETVFAINTSELPFLGSKDAPVTLAVFSDYQWPSCARLEPLLLQLLEKYPGKIKIFFKNFPLSSHQFAKQAALAALAANRQGKFKKFHDTLFENFDKLSDDKINEIAKSLGLDMEQFNKDVQDPAIARLVARDRTEGEQMGIRSVPTLFVNGRFFSRGSDLYQMIEEEITPATK